MKHKPTAPTGANGPFVRNCNKTATLSGPALRRVLNAAEIAITNGARVLPTVARATGYCEDTVADALAKAWQGERVARMTLTSGLKGSIDEANRAFWSTAIGEAA